MALASLLLLGACKTELNRGLSENEANDEVAILLRAGIPASREVADKAGTMTVYVDQNRFADAVGTLQQHGYPKPRFASIGSVFAGNGLVSSPSQNVVCPKQITVDGTVFNNSGGESEPANTPFLEDFAVSCNNAFGQWYNQIGATTLANTAQKYYGLNEPWDIGTGRTNTYYTTPSSASNGELFQELFGQGELETAPIALASVAATVDNGTFKQPVVVPGAAQVTATPLPTNVQQDLWQMMHAVVYQADGTAYNVFNGVSSTVYGKTGTADVGTTQDKPNSWMAVFDPTLNVAIACVVLDAGYGASFAGPETAAALQGMQ